MEFVKTQRLFSILKCMSWMNQFVNNFLSAGTGESLFKCKKAIRFSHSFVHCQPLFPLFSVNPLCHFTIKPLSATLSSLLVSSSLCHPSSTTLSFITPVVLTMCEWGWMMGGRTHARGSYTSAWHIQTHSLRNTCTHPPGMLVDACGGMGRRMSHSARHMARSQEAASDLIWH